MEEEEGAVVGEPWDVPHRLGGEAEDGVVLDEGVVGVGEPGEEAGEAREAGVGVGGVEGPPCAEEGRAGEEEGAAAGLGDHDDVGDDLEAQGAEVLDDLGAHTGCS